MEVVLKIAKINKKLVSIIDIIELDSKSEVSAKVKLVVKFIKPAEYQKSQKKA